MVFGQDTARYGPAGCKSHCKHIGLRIKCDHQNGAGSEEQTQSKFSTPGRPFYPMSVIMKWWHWFYSLHNWTCIRNILYHFSIAALTKDHKLGGLKQHKFITLQFFGLEVLKSKCQLHFFVEAVGSDSPVSRGCPAFLGLWSPFSILKASSSGLRPSHIYHSDLVSIVTYLSLISSVSFLHF